MTKEELLLCRRRKGLTQAQLGAVIKASRQAIIHWERGNHPIPDNMALRILAACEEDVPAKRMDNERDAYIFSLYAKARRDGISHAFLVRNAVKMNWEFTPALQARIVAEFPDVLTTNNED